MQERPQKEVGIRSKRAQLKGVCVRVHVCVCVCVCISYKKSFKVFE